MCMGSPADSNLSAGKHQGYQSQKNLETLIRNKLMPIIMGGREINDESRLILNLPARLEGMEFLYPSEEAD